MTEPAPGPERPPPPAPAGVRPRLAGSIAVAAGGTAAIACVVAAPDTPWWGPILLFAIAAILTWRLLRPQPRRPGWEDEI